MKGLLILLLATLSNRAWRGSFFDEVKFSAISVKKVGFILWFRCLKSVFLISLATGKDADVVTFHINM